MAVILAVVAELSRPDSSARGSAGPGGDDGDVRNWSSLIGIAIAVVGNTIIALAFNVQRYAHVRIRRERARMASRAGQPSDPTRRRHAPFPSRGYGSAEGGSRGEAQPADGAARDDDEHVPLIPRYHESSGSDCTGVPDSGDDDEGDDGDGDDGRGDRRSRSTYLKSPYWWIGQILIFVGEAGNFIAYGFAPASIVSPLGVVAMIANCIIAPIIFGEEFRPQDFWGVIIAIWGAVTVVLSAKQKETRLEPGDIWKAITTTEFEIYMGVSAAVIASLIAASRTYGKRTILVDLGLVGLFGGYTVLATKGVSSMLSSLFLRAFTYPLTYFLLLVVLATALPQIRYVNRALQRFGSTQVIPVQFVMFTLSVIVGSAVLYRDFERTTPEQAVKFTGGCLLTFFGVFLITNGRKPNGDDEDHGEDPENTLSDVEGLAETIGLTPRDAACSPARAEGTPSVTSSRRSSRASRPSLVGTPGRSPYLFGDGSTASSSLRKMPHPQNPHAPVVSGSTPIISYLGSSDHLGVGQGLPVYSDTALVGSDANVLSRAETEPTALPDGQQGTSIAPFARRHSVQRTSTYFSPSPLSTTVTAVVKDALLGQLDGDARLPTSSIRRIRSSIRAGLFLSDRDYGGATAAGGNGSAHAARDPVTAVDGPGEPLGDGVPSASDSQTRFRSLSDGAGVMLARPSIQREKTINGNACRPPPTVQPGPVGS